MGQTLDYRADIMIHLNNTPDFVPDSGPLPIPSEEMAQLYADTRNQSSRRRLAACDRIGALAKELDPLQQDALLGQLRALTIDSQYDVRTAALSAIAKWGPLAKTALPEVKAQTTSIDSDAQVASFAALSAIGLEISEVRELLRKGLDLIRNWPYPNLGKGNGYNYLYQLYRRLLSSPPNKQIDIELLPELLQMLELEEDDPEMESLLRDCRRHAAEALGRVAPELLSARQREKIERALLVAASGADAELWEQVIETSVELTSVSWKSIPI